MILTALATGVGIEIMLSVSPKFPTDNFGQSVLAVLATVNTVLCLPMYFHFQHILKKQKLQDEVVVNSQDGASLAYILSRFGIENARVSGEQGSEVLVLLPENVFD